MLIKLSATTVRLFSCVRSLINYIFTGIRAAPGGTADYTSGINSAILRYVGAPATEPTTNSTASNLLDEQSLHVRVLFRASPSN